MHDEWYEKEVIIMSLLTNIIAVDKYWSFQSGKNLINAEIT